MKSIKISCRNCGLLTELEAMFCPLCRHRLIPLTPYDISLEDYAYPPDEDVLEALKELQPLANMIKALVIDKHVKRIKSQLSRDAVKVSPSSSLGSMIKDCAVMLGIEILPESFIIPSRRLEAFTIGSDNDPILFISSSMLKKLAKDELKAVIGHELGHIKSRHMEYHTLAELLMKGAALSLDIIGLNMLSPILKMLLLSWHRESELSADRASLLIVKDPDIIKSLLSKLSHEKGRVEAPLSELLSMHPSYAERVKEIEEYYQSAEFARARQKLEKRLMISKALIPFCKFCGADKPITAIFCPICGKSHL